MLNSHTRSVVPLALALFVAGGALAQTPAALPRVNVTADPQTFPLDGVAVDGLGNVTLLWKHSRTSRAFWRRFSGSDEALGGDLLLAKCCTDPKAAANERGDTVMIWNQAANQGGDQLLVRRLGPGLPFTLRVASNRGRGVSIGAGDVDIDRQGRFVAVWTEAANAGGRVHGQRFNADGTRRGPVFTVNAPGVQVEPRVAMNDLTGEFVVIWQNPDPLAPAIFGQRFGFTSGRQGSEFQVNAPEAGLILEAGVDRAADGSFVVVWRHYPSAIDNVEGEVRAQRFDAVGERDGDEIPVSGGVPRFGGNAAVAVAPAGQLAVVWNLDASPNLQLRIFRRDGTPAAPVLEVPPRSSPLSPQLAFGWNGTFVLAWIGGGVNYQRFAAAPGEEVCLFRNGHFRCDAARTGGAPEIDHLFAVRRGVPLLGDVDGDGRDDYCLFRETRFDCDSGRDYGAPEFTALFGQPGDTPLLGDLSGDGRDEACVFRSDRFLCDTAQDGGAAEVEIAFGQPGDAALLGDLDGDGRDDPCVLRGGELRCDTARNGGAAELVIAFSVPGGTPLLGDFDGDGRDDPCFYGSGMLSCDTAHDGGAAEATLAFATAAGARPLIGNVDGI